MKYLILITLSLVLSCAPEVTPLDKELKINVEFFHYEPAKINSGIKILEKYMVTEEFKDFSDPYPDVYEEILLDWDIDILIIENSNLSARAPLSYNIEDKVIKYRPEGADAKSDNRIAAILLHEYLHHLGHHHPHEGPGTPGYHFQLEFEKWLNKYNNAGK